MGPSPLLQAWNQARAAQGRTQAPDSLADSLEAWVRTAQERWPELGLSAKRFVASVAERNHEGEEGAAPWERLLAPDLWLAYGCLSHLQGAAEVLVRAHTGAVDSAHRKLRERHLEQEELRQSVWKKLLVGTPPAPPKLQEYSGRGPLGVWIHMVAMRLLLEEGRKRQRRERRDILQANPEELWRRSAVDSPELAQLKGACRIHFKQAFEAALKALSPQERNLLRQTYVHGASAEQLAALHQVHRVTVARWLGQARRKLLMQTREGLAHALQVPPSELRSILRLVSTGVDISLEKVLRTS